MFNFTMPTSLLRIGAHNPNKSGPFPSEAERRAKGIVAVLGMLAVAAAIAAVSALPQHGISLQSTEDTISATEAPQKLYEPRYDLMLPRYQLPLPAHASSV